MVDGRGPHDWRGPEWQAESAAAGYAVSAHDVPQDVCAPHVLERAGRKPQGRSGACTHLVQDATKVKTWAGFGHPSLCPCRVVTKTKRARTAADRNIPSNLQTAFPCRK
jgi:molybdopterin biosynthesis enzyme